MSWKPSEIKALRQALGKTFAEFASKFSLSRSLVAYWEKGKKSPTTDVHKILEQLKKEILTDLERCNVNTPGEIKALREALGLTQAALAKKLKISKRLVIYWETGKRSPSPFFQAKLKRLALQANKKALRAKGFTASPQSPSENSEGEQNVTSEEGEQIVTSEEGEQIVTSEEGEQIMTSEEGGQNVTSENESITLSFGGQAENIAHLNCKEAALEYLSYGWSVIPLCPPDCSPLKVPWHWRDSKCAHPGKVPLVAWTVYQERLPTEEEVSQWFSQWPFANVGIVTGRVSKLLVVDFDDNIAIDAIKKFGGFEKAPFVQTGGGGQHNYFQHPLEGLIANFAGKLKSVNPDLEKVDLRASGGQVVAPPSLHVSGNRYVWTVPPNEVKPPSLPKWFFDLFQKPTASKQTNKDATLKRAPPFVVKKASRLPDNFEVLKKCDSLIKSLWSFPSSGSFPLECCCELRYT